MAAACGKRAVFVAGILTAGSPGEPPAKLLVSAHMPHKPLERTKVQLLHHMSRADLFLQLDTRTSRHGSLRKVRRLTWLQQHIALSDINSIELCTSRGSSCSSFWSSVCTSSHCLRALLHCCACPSAVSPEARSGASVTVASRRTCTHMHGDGDTVRHACCPHSAKDVQRRRLEAG